MSQHRVSPAAGWVDLKQHPRGPDGRGLCRFCGREVPKGRRTFCSEACVTEHRIRSDPGFARLQVYRRDHGVCALCGRDMEAAIKELRRLDRYDYSTRRPIALINPPWLPYGRTDPSVDRVTWWESDHIVPVVEGGGECGLEGLRTLCWRCHRAETAALAKRRRKPKPTTLLLFEETSP